MWGTCFASSCHILVPQRQRGLPRGARRLLPSPESLCEALRMPLPPPSTTGLDSHSTCRRHALPGETAAQAAVVRAQQQPRRRPRSIKHAAFHRLLWKNGSPLKEQLDLTGQRLGLDLGCVDLTYSLAMPGLERVSPQTRKLLGGGGNLVSHVPNYKKGKLFLPTDSPQVPAAPAGGGRESPRGLRA